MPSKRRMLVRAGAVVDVARCGAARGSSAAAVSARNWRRVDRRAVLPLLERKLGRELEGGGELCPVRLPASCLWLDTLSVALGRGSQVPCHRLAATAPTDRPNRLCQRSSRTAAQASRIRREGLQPLLLQPPLVHIFRAQVEVGKARLPHRQSLPQQGHRQSVAAPAGAYGKAASAWELSEPDVCDRCERTCCVSVPMPQETIPWSDAGANGACLSVVADAQSLWSSVDDTSFRRSAASESSRPEGFISDMEAAEDAVMWAETYGPIGSLG